LKLGRKEQLFYSSLIQTIEENFERIKLIPPTGGIDEERSYFYLVGFNLQSNDLVSLLVKLLEDSKKGAIISIFNENNEILENYGKKLLDKFTPLWESQYTSMVKKFGIEEIIEPPSSLNVSSPPVVGTNFVYSFDLDTNGIIYHLNGGNQKDDKSGIVVSSSSVAVGEVVDFINRNKARCWTQNQPYSWYQVDLGSERKVIPTHYTMGYGSPGTGCYPLFWLFQGSNSITRTSETYGSKPDDIPQNDTDWRTLSVHNNDRSLFGDWAVHTWKLNTCQAYRYFRVIQTGPNSFNPNNEEDNWGQVLVANRFEIYGCLLPSSTAVVGRLSQPTYPIFFYVELQIFF